MKQQTIELTSIASAKCAYLEEQGYKLVGVMLANDDNNTAFIDEFGRVIWLGPIDPRVLEQIRL
jgi:hypothetical protein